MDKQVTNYINEIMRHIKLRSDTKKRIKDDLESDIETRLEQGDNLEMIIADMGTPKEVANQLCAELPIDKYPMHKIIRWVFIIFALVPLVIMLYAFWQLRFTLPSDIKVPAYILHKFAVTPRLFIYILNLALHWISCACGFMSFSGRWNSGDKRFLWIGIVAAVMWIIQSPVVLGVNILFIPYPYDPFWIKVVKGLLQPQCLMSLAVCILSLWVYFKNKANKHLSNK